MTGYAAAQKVKQYLIEKRGADPEGILLLGKTGERNVQTHGFYAEGAEAQVVYEGDYEWVFADAIREIEMPGIWVEPATGFALTFYKAD